MGRFSQSLIYVLGLILVASPASAVLLDFEGLPFAPGTGGNFPAAVNVLTDDFESDGVLFGRAGLSAGVVVVEAPASFGPSSGILSVTGLLADGFWPSASIGDIYFEFVIPNTVLSSTVDSVSFTIGDAGGDLDPFQIRSYNLADALIDTQNVSGDSRFAVSIVAPGIHRVEIDFLNASGGYSMDDLAFDLPGGVVPEPATMMLMGLGLAGFVLRRRMKA